MTPTHAEATPIERYYRLHSRIYDATRWSFLFGRSRLLRHLEAEPPQRILEVGCGTGRNLLALGRRFPQATLAGVDLSPAMLRLASRKLERHRLVAEWHQRSYHAPIASDEPFDLVVFSYALSMFNPGFEAAIEAAHADLVPGGRIAVVDFHRSRFRWFERWMGLNHVRMQGHLVPYLAARFALQKAEVRSAYGGVWDYFLWFGRR